MRRSTALPRILTTLVASYLTFGDAVGQGTVAPPPAVPLTAPDLETWLDGVVPYAIEQADIAGAVVVVLKDGQVLLQKGYGYADVARKKPMDPERTVLGVGSVSKLFTWTAVMQQVEQGKLDLDRDINQYLDFIIPPAFGKPITLRHLMTHMAGFAERTFKVVGPGGTPRALHEYIKGNPVPARIFPPGEVAAYSNYGSMLAGYIVERVSGERFVDYVDRHILKPLGMAHSTFRRPLPESLRPDFATPYRQASQAPIELENEEPAGDPSGHLSTTAADLSRFMLAHLAEGRTGDTIPLKPETMRLMHAPAAVPVRGGHPMTLGFFRTDRNGHRSIGHDGDIGGFHAELDLLPDDGVGFLIIVNSDGMPAGLLDASISLRWTLFQHFMNRYFPAAPEPELPTAATAKEHAQLVAGQYQMSRRAVGNFMAVQSLINNYVLGLSITAHEDGTIETPPFLNFGRPVAQRWREVGPFSWQEVGGRAMFDMEMVDGKVKAALPRDLYSFVLQPVPFFWSAALQMPLLIAAASVIGLAVMFWPIGILVRRHYHARIEQTPREAKAKRAMHLGVLAGLVFLLGWGFVFGANLSSQLGKEWEIRIVQAIGLLMVLGAAGVAWNAWVTLQGRTGWWNKVWSVIVTAAMVDLVWFSFAFKLMSLHLNY